MKFPDEKDRMFSSFVERKYLFPHDREEWENDVIGNYRKYRLQ
jgi:hypothetical protein